MEMTASGRCLLIVLITGNTRRNSSSALTAALAPGRVDSPPMSMMSAPSLSNPMACSVAFSESRYTPPSENESGVTLTMPMIRVRLPSSSVRVPRLHSKTALMRQILNERGDGGEEAELLSATDCRVPLAHGPKRAGACTGRRFAHSVEQVLEHNCVVARLVLRGEQEREAFPLVGQRVKFLQVFFRFGTGQLLQVTLAESLPLFGLSVNHFRNSLDGARSRSHS